MEFMPEKYKHMISGPSLQVDVHTGAIAEAILSFGITFAVLLIILKGPRRLLAKTFLLSLATISFVVAGSKYTGPAMNPAIVSFTLCLIPLPDTFQHPCSHHVTDIFYCVKLNDVSKSVLVVFAM